MRENSHWYCMLCTKTFFPISDLNETELKQSSENKLNKFTHIAKSAISNAENFIQVLILRATLLNILQLKI